MNIHKIISELQAEKQRLDDAIGALERLAAGNRQHRRRTQSSPKPSAPAEESANTDVSHPRPH